MRILCYGDSNTWGHDPKTHLRFDARWTRLLAQMLPEDEIIEEGLNGRTFCFDDPFTPGRNGLAALPTILMSQDPIDLVIVMLGTNDLKTTYPGQAGVIAKGARSFIRTIRTPYLYNYAVPKILMVSPIELGKNIAEKEGPFGGFNKESLEQSRYLGQAIEQVCKDAGGEVVGIYYMNAADYAQAGTYDCIHLDEAGHAALAQALYEKIQSI